MRVAAVADGLVERALLAMGLLPTPLVDTLVTLWLARSVMAATELGVFEALKDGPHTAADVARRCGTHPAATARLLDALVGAGYLRARGDRRELAAVARRWLIDDRSLRDNVRFRYVEWELVAGYERYVRTGEAIDIHDRLSPEAWSAYQRGMRSLALRAAPIVARRIPVPPGSRVLLDVGGGHGCYAAALCRRHPELRATVVDLPQALEEGARLVEAERLGDRVTTRAADVRTADFGRDLFDVALVVDLVHHFDAATNRTLVRRIAAALRPGGVLAIVDLVHDGRRPRQIEALLALYFAVTSAGGTWSVADLAAWQEAAGLAPRAPRRVRRLPGVAIQCAVKATPTVPVDALTAADEPLPDLDPAYGPVALGSRLHGV